MKEYYTYIMCNYWDTVLYVGMTNDISRRVLEHKSLSTRSFTRQYKCTKLVWFETFTTPTEAIRMEKKIKRWPRQWKINLVGERNPHFEDLAKDDYWVR